MLYPVMQAIGKQRHAQRPDFGKGGRPLKLTANHFKVACTLKEASFPSSMSAVPKMTMVFSDWLADRK